LPLVGGSTLFAWEEGHSPRLFRILENRRDLLWEIVDDSQLRVTEDVVAKLNVLHKDYGVRFSVHTPFMHKDILSSDRIKREESLSDIRRSIALAAKYEAEYAVIHPGLKNEGLSVAEIVGVWEDLLSTCADFGLTGLIENLTRKSVLYRPQDLCDFRRAIKGPNFMLDTGHANIEGTLDSFMEVVRDLSYFHIHDNEGGVDSHLRLGRGNINWDRFFSRVIQFRPDAPLVVENMTVGDLDESVRFALKRLS
jgi:sugar phosphate isomerase/epimerase